MKVKREEHKVWTLWNQARESPVYTKLLNDEEMQESKRQIGYSVLDPIIGQWHYKYYSDDGKKYISLVELLHFGFPWRKGPQWEICSNGTCSNCADAEERFDSQAEAEERIKELFGESEITREYQE